jgi:hypothetical protein
MELSRLRRTASLNFGALLNRGSSMPLTRNAPSAKVGDTSSTAAVDKSSARTAVALYVSEQEPSPVSKAYVGQAVAAAPPPVVVGESLDDWANRMAGLPPTLSAGVKLDSGKAPVAQAFVAYFRKAMEAVAKVSAYGANKYKVAYAEQNWRKVDNGANRYADALQRHFGAHLGGETIDPESKEPHMAHVAWNALALLELQNAAPEKLVDGQ